MIFVDSNVILDILTPDQQWRDWSNAQLIKFSAEGAELVVNQIVLAEVAANFPDLRELVAALDSIDIEVLPFSDETAFLAGQTFRRYRREGRDRTAILADFLIGAHAVELGAPLLTRDRKLYGRYFPDLALITPETHP